MIIETKRLILRPWEEADAESLYEYAKDPKVGPIAGWPIHTSVENSKEIIRNVLSAQHTFAVTLKGENKAIGSIGLMIGKDSNIEILEDEAELGYWIGVPFWGNAYIPEASRALIQYAFTELKMKKVWCGYFEGNEKSKRVQEKCGFKPHHMEKDKRWELMNDIRTEYITCLTFEDWNVHIDIADTKDAKELLAIYAPYVENTAITFEYEVPSVEEFESRIRNVQKRFPYLIAKAGEEIVGYAYVSPFKARPAYDWAVETSIYVKMEKRSMGIGKKLYRTLEEILKAQNILNLNACIAYPQEEDEYLTTDSVDFHSHLGYQMAGEFHQCGYKFNRWYNMVWMEKHIGIHREHQPKVKTFDEVKVGFFS